MPSAALAQETSTELAPKFKPTQEIMPAVSDSMHINLPALTELGQLPVVFPYFGMGSYMWPTWNLHSGLNVSLGASVFTTFGSGNTWSGAGFAENASLMYAAPIGKRLSLAIGGYIRNASWAHDSYRSAGLTALLNYQATDRLNIYMYGQKSLIGDKHMPLPLYDVADMADRIGVGAEYKVTPAFSIGISVDYTHYNNDMPLFMRNGPQDMHQNQQK